MPLPLYSGVPFTRQKTAKASFDFDNSDTEFSTPYKTPESFDCNSRAASELLLEPGNHNEDKVTLLTLPLEIRDKIYELLLVRQFSETNRWFWALKRSNRAMVDIGIYAIPRDPTISPAILRTNKQVYHEAKSILYSQNIFSFGDPKDLFDLVQEIGLPTFKLLKSIHLYVIFGRDMPGWLRLLPFLAAEAKGLRDIEVEWAVDTHLPAELERGHRARGLGDNLAFVRALGNLGGLTGLEKLIISGFYGKHWKAFLEEKMGIQVQVQAICGGYPWDYEVEMQSDEERERRKEIMMHQFKLYQDATEDLIP